jgi:HSP20 family protein
MEPSYTPIYTKEDTMAEQQTSTKVAPKRDSLARFLDFPQEMGRFFDRDYWPWPAARFFREGAWAPRIDVYEEGNELVVRADLPGVKREEVQVTVDGDQLVLRGERKEEKEIKEERYYRSERSYGSFYRSITLPGAVDPKDIKAQLRDGVLEVRVPKPAPEKAAGTAIPVQ